jgi:hypothetical protein
MSELADTSDAEFAAITASLPSLTWGSMGGSPWNHLTEGYWRAAGRGELAVPKCSACGVHRWPPNEICYACQSLEWTWDVVPPRGIIYTYTWSDHPIVPSAGVYNMTVVELAETTGDPVRVLSRVVDVGRDDLRCNAPVEVHFEDVGGGIAVPLWKLVDA